MHCFCSTPLVFRFTQPPRARQSSFSPHTFPIQSASCACCPVPPLALFLLPTHDSLFLPLPNTQAAPSPQARPPPQCCCSTRPGNHPCAPPSSRQAPYRGFCVRGFVYGACVPKKDALLQLLLEPEAPVWLPPSPGTTPARHHRLALANHGTFFAGVHPAHWGLESSAAPG